jgi:competence protein ComEA
MTVYSSEDNIKLININEDPLEILVTLPGIGPGLAKRIIEYREISRFEKIEDILDVIGVGPGNFSKFERLITVGE